MLYGVLCIVCFHTMLTWSVPSRALHWRRKNMIMRPNPQADWCDGQPLSANKISHRFLGETDTIQTSWSWFNNIFLHVPLIIYSNTHIINMNVYICPRAYQRLCRIVYIWQTMAVKSDYATYPPWFVDVIRPNSKGAKTSLDRNVGTILLVKVGGTMSSTGSNSGSIITETFE